MAAKINTALKKDGILLFLTQVLLFFGLNPGNAFVTNCHAGLHLAV
jgi:hypothetical protein